MPKDVLGEFEETALMGCKAVREFLTYSGDNKAYLNRAKAGAVAMGSYARLRATLANERQIALVEKRINDGLPVLPAAHDAVASEKVLPASVQGKGMAQSESGPVESNQAPLSPEGPRTYTGTVAGTGQRLELQSSGAGAPTAGSVGLCESGTAS